MPTIGPNGETPIDDDFIPGGVAFLKDHVQYIHGYPDGSVRVDTNVTRAEAITIIFRLIDDEGKTTPTQSSFYDVPDNEWYSQAVAYAEGKGIVIGYPDGGFHPDDWLTRAEFATLVSRFVSLEQQEESLRFSDVPDDHWAEPYIYKCVAQGLIIGFPDGTFRPENLNTRAEVVVIMNRLLNRGIALADIPEGVPVYSDLPIDHWAYSHVIEASVEHDYILNEENSEIWQWPPATIE